jgi:hypothetical protein
MEGEVAEWQSGRRRCVWEVEWVGLAMGSKETGVWLFSGMGWIMDGDGDAMNE